MLVSSTVTVGFTSFTSPGVSTLLAIPAKVFAISCGVHSTSVGRELRPLCHRQLPFEQPPPLNPPKLRNDRTGW